MRGVPPVQDDRVAVGVLDEAHVADARVLYTDHLGARRTNLLDRRSHIGDAERDSGDVRGELLAVALRAPESERDVRRLDLGRCMPTDGQTEHVLVEGDCPAHVSRRNGYEVDLLDAHTD